MNTLETDITEYLAHLRAQLEQIEREVTGMALVEDQVWDVNGIHIVSNYDQPTSTFIANARTAYPASIAWEIRLVETLLELAKFGNGSRIGNSLGNDIATRALRDIIAEWKGVDQ